MYVFCLYLCMKYELLNLGIIMPRSSFELSLYAFYYSLYACNYSLYACRNSDGAYKTNCSAAQLY